MSKGPQFEAPVGHRIRRCDEAGGALRSASYTANSLNQYTSRDVPAYLNVLGIANANASVTVNSNSAYRRGEYFWKELSVTNTSVAQWQGVTNIASLTGTNQTNTGNLFLPKTAEAYTYDLDGNLTSDGRWTNKWDAENRLIDMTSHSSGPSGSRKSLQFAYDSQGRRYSKVVSNWTGSAWTRVLHEKFQYDGWNLLGAFSGTDSAIIRSFLWGLDLSGSMQGAGGVGGLIAFRQHSGSLSGSHFAAYDGNGNVMALVDGKTGSASARYEYDPFGQTIRASGTMATVNPVRFSSKVVDDETDYAYYGYRYLNPNSGRWLNRDPLAERAGKNLYGFARNDGINFFDADGRITVTTLTKNPKSDCGSADIKWEFVLDQPAPDDGYIVQKVTREYDYQSCDGKTKVKTKETFWEAWLVKKGQTKETGAALYGFTDNAGEPARPQTRGTLTKAGEIKFFLKGQAGNLGDPGVNPPVPPDPTTGFGGNNGNPSSGGLPSSNNEPAWWKNPSDNGEKTGTRSVTTLWDCCCKTPGFIGPILESITVTP